MDFIDKVKQFSKRIDMLKGNLATEEATKTALIMPFFNLLDYDVFNPIEFVPEFTADIGTKKGEKVVVPADIQAFKINDETIFVFLPYELFCTTGNEIEKKLQDLGYEYGKIFVIGYANYVRTYLPPKKYYHDGGYDLGGRLSGSHWNGLPEYAENAEEIVIDGIINLVKEM